MFNEEVIEAEVTDIEVRPRGEMVIQPELTADSLRAEIAKQDEMREIMTEYVRTKMVEGKHYYRFADKGPPALTQDGAYFLCNLFKCIPGPVDTTIDHEEGGHFTVTAEATIFNASGGQIATGDGRCTTRESKYAYRWGKESDVPPNLDITKLKSRGGVNKGGGGTWKQYQIPNADLADLENTVLKMAVKRATVAAVRKLQLVSELFVVDPADAPAKQKTSPAAQAKAPSAAEVRQNTVKAFGEIGVTIEQLVEYLDKPINEANPSDVNNLREIYSSIKKDGKTWEDYAPQAPQAVEPEPPNTPAPPIDKAESRLIDLRTAINERVAELGGPDKLSGDSRRDYEALGDMDIEAAKKFLELLG